MNQNILRDASHVGVFGKSGQGKTSYAERYITAGHHGRVLIFDHQGEFSQRLGVTPVFDYEEMNERAQKERILCFDYSMGWEGQLEESFDEFCHYAFDFSKQHMAPRKIDCLFVCDELQKIVGVNCAPKSIKNIVQTGRRFHLDSLILGQAPNQIHNSIRGQWTELVLYKLQDENATDFAHQMGFDVDEVLALEKLHYNWYQLNTGEKRLNKQITFAKTAR